MSAVSPTFRRLPFLLLALLLWGVGAPLVAVTCVPSAPCAGLMASCPLASAERPSDPAVAAPDCCEQSVRESEPAGIPSAKLQALAACDLPVALVSPPSPRDHGSGRRTAEPVAATGVPLYTLHSILLI